MRDKLTEDQTIKILMTYLTKTGWTIESNCFGQSKGTDIVATKKDKKLLIEVKGAKASENSKTKRRKCFDSGQIKTHFGKAIVKLLEDKHNNPKSEIALAHPNDKDIIRVIGHLISELKPLGIRHFWVSPDGDVNENLLQL